MHEILGDYRNFIEVGGRRISHAIDPRSGYPVPDTIASVTVVGPSAMRADAMATALLVAGAEIGYALAVREEVAALFILRRNGEFEEQATPQFAAYLLPEE